MNVDNLNQPSPPQLNRINKLIQKAMDTGKITPEAFAWIKAAADPWHDTTILDVRGIPDTETGVSLVLSVVQEQEIAADVSWGATQNWDLRINTNPYETNANLIFGSARAQVLSQVNSAVIDYPTGGVDWTRSLPNVDFLPGGAGQSLNIPLTFCTGIVKVIGKGLEVLNSTAELYQQGTISCARYNQPEFSQQTSYLAKSTPGAWTVMSTFPVRTPPKNLSELNLQPIKTSWHAKEGMYSPIIMKVENQTHMPVATYPVMYAGDTSAGPATDVPAYSPHTLVYTVNGTNFHVPDIQTLVSPQDSVVVILSGLHRQATIKVRCRWIIELFPTQDDVKSLAASTPTCPYDPTALEVYSRICQSFPAAVPYSENPEGEWWKKTLGAIGDVVGPLVSMIPHPAAQLAGGVITQGAKALNQGAKEDKAKRKAKNLTRPPDRQKNSRGQIKPVPSPKLKQK